MQTAATATKTQQELVRLLVLQHGLQKASELSGVPYELVRQWESRRKRRAIKAVQKAGVTVSQGNPATIVANNVESELAEAERETKLSLARSVKRLSKDAEQATLRHSGEVKNVAQTAAIVHRWDAKEQSSGNVVVNVAILGIDPSEVSVKGEVVSEAD